MATTKFKKIKLFDKKYYKNLIGVKGEESTNRIKRLKNKLRFDEQRLNLGMENVVFKP